VPCPSRFRAAAPRVSVGQKMAEVEARLSLNPRREFAGEEYCDGFSHLLCSGAWTDVPGSSSLLPWALSPCSSSALPQVRHTTIFPRRQSAFSGDRVRTRMPRPASSREYRCRAVNSSAFRNRNRGIRSLLDYRRDKRSVMTRQASACIRFPGILKTLGLILSQRCAKTSGVNPAKMSCDTTPPHCYALRMKRLGLLFLCIELVIMLGIAAFPTSFIAAQGQGVPCPLAVGWTPLASPEPPISSLDTGGVLGTATIAAGWSAPGLLYTGGPQGLFRSHDCGQNWEGIPLPLLPGTEGRPNYVVSSVAVGLHDRLLVGGTGSEPIMVSTDDGVTWQGAPWRGRSLTTSPASEEVVYAMSYSDNTSRGPVGVARSVDGGRSWEIRNRYPAGVVAADALDPNVVYLGAGRCRFASDSPPCGWLARSLDGGTSFEQLADFEGVPTAMTMSLDGSRFWLGTHDGTLYSSPDQGTSWHAVTRVPGDVPGRRSIRALSASPHDPSLVFAVTYPPQVWAYREPSTSAPQS
jgi:hypothetical protein